MWTYSLVPPDPLLHLSSSSIRCVPEVAPFPPLCNKVDIAGKPLHLRHHSPKRGLLAQTHTSRKTKGKIEVPEEKSF